ncbi:MAG: ABC transporter permease, partial [Clostridiales bacterium]|nr:ABC transporter permease [Clostridiales bacterium]
FGIQLWMYATPVVYPLSTVSGALKTVLILNPVTSSAELVRLSLLGAGTVTFPDVIYSSAVAVVTAICGIVVFNKVERTFADTI